MTGKPRVARTIVTYSRDAQCAKCGRRAKQSRTFEADTMDEIDAIMDLVEAWGRTPLLCKRCER